MKTVAILIGICLIMFSCQKEPPATKIEGITTTENPPGNLSTEDYFVPQYRLSVPRTIRVRYIGLPAGLVTALIQAINNYNVLQLKLKFALVTTTADITVEGRVLDAGTLASSGYPSQDKPYPTIIVNAGPQGLSNPANAGIARRVLQHELGHCIGLIHPDRTMVRPCGPPTEPPIGAIHVPGTPTGLDTLSLMLRCNPGDVFSQRDIQSLKWMYN